MIAMWSFLEFVNRLLIAVIGIGWSFLAMTPNITMTENGPEEGARGKLGIMVAFVSMFCSFIGGIVGCFTNSWSWLMPAAILQIVALYIYDPEGMSKSIEKGVDFVVSKVTSIIATIRERGETGQAQGEADEETAGESQPLMKT